MSIVPSQWRTTHLVSVLLACAAGMVLLAVGVGIASESNLRTAVQTNTENADISLQLDRVDDLVAQLVLQARQPPTVINSPELMQRRSGVISEEVIRLSSLMDQATGWQDVTSTELSLRLRLDATIGSIANHARRSLEPADNRSEQLALLDASYRLFRDDVRNIRESAAAYESLMLRNQADASRSTSQVVILASALGVLIVGLAGGVGLRIARRDSELNAALGQQVVEDSLTGLANRQGLLEALAAQQDSDQSSAAALCFLDIDHFKRINDSLGHALGDEVLCIVAERLKERFPAPNVAARIGGDEFAIVVVDGTAPVEAAQAAARIVSVPVHLEGHVIELKASVGVRRVDRGLDGITALRHADLAMYQAKGDSTLCFAEFDMSLVEFAERSMDLESKLRTAIRDGALQVYYQPFMGSDGRVVGAEALVRWFQDGRLIPPADFLPLASQLGLIKDIDDWVLHQATRDMARFNEYFGWDMYVSVNIDAQTLGASPVVQRVTNALSESGLAPECLMVEVTEQAVIDNIDAAVEVLGEIRAIGCRSAMDDFGTGHSSVTRLDRLPIDVVKIDRALLPASPNDTRRAELFSGVVEMVRQLGYAVIAEGIETVDQEQLAKAARCEALQGYLLGKPSPARELVGAIARSLGDGSGVDPADFERELDSRLRL